jgi:hypothetical protein
VCLEWFNIIDYRDFGIYLTTKSSWPQIADRLSTFNKPISLRFHKNIIKRLSDINEHLLRLTNITALAFDDVESEDAEMDDPWFKLTSLPNLQSVYVKNFYNDIPLAPLLSLRHLTNFHQNALKPENKTEKIMQSIRGWINLEHCTISQGFPFPENGLFESYHTRLTSLSLSVPGVTDKWFENLGGLKFLDYYAKDTLSDTNLSLKHLTALESLVLFGSQIHELTSTNLTKLELFAVEEKFLEREGDKLGNVKELILDLRERPKDLKAENFHSYEWLTTMTTLEYLQIAPIQHKGLSFVSTTLKSLDIAINNNVPADLAHVSRFASLKQLYVVCYNHKDQGIVDISPISMLTQLESLHINFGYVTLPVPFAISTLSNLTLLELSGAPAEVSNLPNLENLRLIFSPECQFTGFVGLPKLTALDVSNNAIDFTLDYNTILSRLTTLKQLALGANNQRYNCQQFSILTALESLHFKAPESSEDYNHLASLTNLTELKIRRGIASPNILMLPTSLQVLSIDLSDEDDGYEFEKSIAAELKQRFPYLYSAFFG